MVEIGSKLECTQIMSPRYLVRYAIRRLKIGVQSSFDSISTVGFDTFSPKILGWPNVQQLWETCHSKVVGLLQMWDIGWGKGGMWKRQILLWGLQQADIFFSVSLFLCRCKFHQGDRSGGVRNCFIGKFYRWISCIKNLYCWTHLSKGPCDL